jgi:ABC-type cobalamin/Fe3+-siderophores transport system ATPase subunit
MRSKLKVENNLGAGRGMSVLARWKRKGQRLLEALGPPRAAKIFVESLQVSGGEKINLKQNSILVIVGPNNAGKSSILREIRDHLQDHYRFGPVLRDATIRITGTVDSFTKQIREAGLATEKVGTIKIGYSEYPLENVSDDIKRGFVGSRAMPLFISYLDAEGRLEITNPADRGDYLSSAPKSVMQWLELDDAAEKAISDIFERTFDAGLILNTLAGNKLMLHVIKRQEIPSEEMPKREEARWLAALPRLHRQGDGMRSFAGTIMGLLVHPTSLIFLDEPEAFLHPPQARKLAEVIVKDVPGECQVIIATHNDAFVRSLLDASGDRVILARISRKETINNVTVLDQDQLTKMWNDPLLRTSDILSALFHEAAILCEGDSDARFYSLLMDATRSLDRDPDVRFYYFGGKDRISGIAKALRAVKIPVVAIVDIDILADTEKFLILFEAMGGDRSSVDSDARAINRIVRERKGQMTGAELAIELRRLGDEVKSEKDVPKITRNKLLQLGKDASNWQRVKQDGYRALDALAFSRISDAAQMVGLLINPEGELEGFCRSVSRTRKSEWLADVVELDFTEDPNLSDARRFAKCIRETTKKRIG